MTVTVTGYSYRRQAGGVAGGYCVLCAVCYVDAAGDPDADAATPTPLHCQLDQVSFVPVKIGLHTATFHHPRNTALRTGTKLEEQAKHLRSVLMTPAESLGMRGTRKHTHTKKHEIVELHARAVALYNPHTPLFPKPA